MPICFLMGYRKEVDLDGRESRKEQGKAEGGMETVIRIYCIKKLYSMKENKKKVNANAH